MEAMPALVTDSTSLDAARRGDAAAFQALVGPQRQGLRGYCYRMLGSLSDAEDAVQETFLRAWKALAAFEGRSTLRAWLFQIATRVSLDLLASRRGRVLPQDVRPPSTLGDVPQLDAQYQHLDPSPDGWLEAEVGPDAIVERKESVALAFLVALQELPATQRAVLVLRDVLGFQATEAAELLDTTVAAANSALQRARATLEARRQSQPRLRPASDEVERSLLARYLKVWEKSDVSELMSLLREDAALSMPPHAQWWLGAPTICAALGHLIASPDAQKFRAVSTTAAGLPCVAVYQRASPTTPWLPAALHVLQVDGDRVARIVAWVVPELFARFGLPTQL